MERRSLAILWTAVVMAGEVLAIANSAAAQGSQPAVVLQRTCLDELKEAIELRNKQKQPMSDEEVRRRTDACLDKITGSNEGTFSCASNLKDYSKAVADLNKACADGGSMLNTFGRQLGAKPEGNAYSACIKNIVRCEQCAATGEAQFGGENFGCEKLASSDDDDEDADSRFDANQAIEAMMAIPSGTLTNLPGVKQSSKIDVDEMRNEIMSCLPGSAEDLKDLRSTVKEAKKDLRDMQKNLLDEQAKIAEINQEREEKMNELRDEAETIQSRAKEASDKIKERVEKQEAAIGEAIEKINADWDKAEADIRRLERAKVQAEVAYAEALANLDRGCHANALARTESVRKEVMEMMKSSTYSAGGFNQLMSAVGRSSRKKFQQLAEQFYRDCRNDRAYKSARESAERQRKLAVDAAADEIANIRKTQERLRNQAKRLQEQERSRVLKAAYADMERVRENMTRDLVKLDRRMQAEAQKAQSKLMTKAMAVNRLQRSVAEEEQDQAEDRTRLRLLVSATKGKRAGKEGSTSAAMSAFATAISAARQVIGTCCLESATSPGAKSGCQSACSFLGGQKGLAGFACEPKGGGDTNGSGSATK